MKTFCLVPGIGLGAFPMAQYYILGRPSRNRFQCVSSSMRTVPEAVPKRNFKYCSPNLHSSWLLRKLISTPCSSWTGSYWGTYLISVSVARTSRILDRFFESWMISGQAYFTMNLVAKARSSECQWILAVFGVEPYHSFPCWWRDREEFWSCPRIVSVEAPLKRQTTTSRRARVLSQNRFDVRIEIVDDSNCTWRCSFTKLMLLTTW